jgi:hypothetical protein
LSRRLKAAAGRSKAHGESRIPRNRRKRRWRLLRWWPNSRVRRRGWRLFKRAPRLVQLGTVLAVLALAALAINAIYQIVRKPSELFFPVSGTLYKTPAETWSQYATLFRRYSTALIGPELLAALAQVEGSGNPIVRTYWRWSWKPRFFELYRPASSAVGMYQITDGTFAEARHYCIRNHRVIEDGPWNEWRSCWFNTLYIRVLPSHAIELTAAYLDRHVAAALERHRAASTPRQRLQLAAVIHLCGAGAGDAFARRHFRLSAVQRCGDHEVSGYLARVQAMQAEFLRLAAQPGL